jgi:hypothetical protein
VEGQTDSFYSTYRAVDLNMARLVLNIYLDKSYLLRFKYFVSEECRMRFIFYVKRVILVPGKSRSEIIFVIDPDLKKRALKNSAGMLSTPTDESQLIGRVDLVNSAIVTLARLHQDNEVHKMFISHLTSAAGYGAPPDLNTFLRNATMPVLPSNAADNVTTSEEADEDSQKLSLSEIKRNREKKRRADIRKGLDTLSQMLLVIDPLLETVLEEREKLLRGTGGSRSRTCPRRVSSSSSATWSL